MENSKLYIKQQEQEKQKLQKPSRRVSSVFRGGAASLDVNLEWSDLYGKK